MAFHIAVIARDFGSIPPVGTILTSLLWGYFLGFFGMASIGFEGVGLGGILLTLGGASLFVPSPSLIRLFFFTLNSPTGF